MLLSSLIHILLLMRVVLDFCISSYVYLPPLKVALPIWGLIGWYTMLTGPRKTLPQWVDSLIMVLWRMIISWSRDAVWVPRNVLSLFAQLFSTKLLDLHWRLLPSSSSTHPPNLDMVASRLARRNRSSMAGSRLRGNIIQDNLVLVYFCWSYLRQSCVFFKLNFCLYSGFNLCYLQTMVLHCQLIL